MAKANEQVASTACDGLALMEEFRVKGQQVPLCSDDVHTRYVDRLSNTFTGCECSMCAEAVSLRHGFSIKCLIGADITVLMYNGIRSSSTADEASFRSNDIKQELDWLAEEEQHQTEPEEPPSEVSAAAATLTSTRLSLRSRQVKCQPQQRRRYG